MSVTYLSCKNCFWWKRQEWSIDRFCHGYGWCEYNVAKRSKREESKCHYFLGKEEEAEITALDKGAIGNGRKEP